MNEFMQVVCALMVLAAMLTGIAWLAYRLELEAAAERQQRRDEIDRINELARRQAAEWAREHRDQIPYRAFHGCPYRYALEQLAKEST